MRRRGERDGKRGREGLSEKKGRTIDDFPHSSSPLPSFGKRDFLYRNSHVSPVPPRPRNFTGSNRSERPTSGVSGSLRRGVGTPPAPEPDLFADVEPPAAVDEPQPILSVCFERVGKGGAGLIERERPFADAAKRKREYGEREWETRKVL